MFGNTSGTLLDCDSLRIVFDNVKEIWYYRGKPDNPDRSVFDENSYAITQSSDHYEKRIYIIDEDLSGIAEEIE